MQIHQTLGLLPSGALSEGHSIKQMVEAVFAKVDLVSNRPTPSRIGFLRHLGPSVAERLFHHRRVQLHHFCAVMPVLLQAVEAFGPAESSTPLLDYQHLMAAPVPVRVAGWTAPHVLVPALPSAAHSTQTSDMSEPKRGPTGSVGAAPAAGALSSGGGPDVAFHALPRPVLAVPPPTCVIDFWPLLASDARLKQRMSADSSRTGNSEPAQNMPQRRVAGIEVVPTKRVRTSLSAMPDLAPLPAPLPLSTEVQIGQSGLPLKMQAPAAWGHADGEDKSPLTPRQPPAPNTEQLVFDPATGAAAALLQLGQCRPGVVGKLEGPVQELDGYADPMLTRATLSSPRPVILTQLVHMNSETAAPHNIAAVGTPTSKQFVLKPQPAPAAAWQQPPQSTAPTVRRYLAPAATVGTGPYGHCWQQPAPQAASALVQTYAPVPQHGLMQVLAMPPTSCAATADTTSAPTVPLGSTSAGCMDVQSVGGDMQWQGTAGAVGHAAASAAPVATRGADGALTITLSVSQQRELLKALLSQHSAFFSRD